MAKKANYPIIRKAARGFALATAYDAELTDHDPQGTEYNLVKRARRSLPQSRLYWQALTAIVQATGQWATKEHLHKEIKLTLGYTTKLINLRTGEAFLSVDSTSFDEMDDDTFKAFFDKAMALIAEYTGIDPLSFYAEWRAA